MDKELLNKLLKESGREGEYEVLTKEDKVNVGCNACGKCCRNRNDILLKKNDIYKLCKALDINNPIDFIMDYCDVYIGDNSKLPIVSLKFKEKFDGSTVCPFLKGNSSGKFLCKVHNHKPSVCRIYPLGRVMMKDEFAYMTHSLDCLPENEKRESSIQDWIGKDMDIDEKYFLNFNYWIKTIHEEINLDKLWKSAEVGQLAFKTFLNILYISDLNHSLEENLETHAPYELYKIFKEALKESNIKCFKGQ